MAKLRPPPTTDSPIPDPRSPIPDPTAFQRDFFARMGDPRPMRQLFEHLPGVYFFVKDRHSRLVCASRPFWEQLGARSEAEIIGRMDHEFFPQHAADHFQGDDHIRKHHHQRLTVEQLAARAQVSPRQLHRKFRDLFGLSVRECLVKTRVQAASDALLHSDRPIAQIAAEFGSCDQSAFTQLFRKHMGLTPRRFRLRYAGG